MTKEPIHLFDNYYFREATPKEFADVYTAYSKNVFADVPYIAIEDWLTNDEKAKQNLLGALLKDRYILKVLILCGTKIIGWHVGRQEESDRYRMGNTGILKEYQGKGIYTAFLPKMLEVYRAKGFQKVVSLHHPGNNQVLVPKLKAGFVVTGFEIDERYGMLVTLTYIFNKKILNAYKFRTGALKPDESIKKYL